MNKVLEERRTFIFENGSYEVWRTNEVNGKHYVSDEAYKKFGVDIDCNSCTCVLSKPIPENWTEVLDDMNLIDFIPEIFQSEQTAFAGDVVVFRNKEKSYSLAFFLEIHGTLFLPYFFYPKTHPATITRSINGQDVEITLTRDEMQKVALAQMYHKLEEDIDKYVVRCMNSDDAGFAEIEAMETEIYAKFLCDIAKKVKSHLEDLETEISYDDKEEVIEKYIYEHFE